MKPAKKFLALNLAILLLATLLMPSALAAKVAIHLDEVVTGNSDMTYTFTPPEDGDYRIVFQEHDNNAPGGSTCATLHLWDYSSSEYEYDHVHTLEKGKSYDIRVFAFEWYFAGTFTLEITLVKKAADPSPRPDEDFSSELPPFTADPVTALADIPYVMGERSRCKMDAAMAGAYIKAIGQAREDMRISVGYGRDGATYDSRYDDLYVALADVAGDGYPLLITAALDKVGAPNREWINWADDPDKGGMVGDCVVWSYRDGVATKGPAVEDYGLLNGEPVLYEEWSALAIPADGQDFHGCYYNVSQGEVTLAYEVASYSYDYQYDSRYQRKGDGDYPMWHYATVNGEDRTGQYRDLTRGVRGLIGEVTRDGGFFSLFPYGIGLCCIDTVPADRAIAELRTLIPTAYASTQMVDVDGTPVEFQCYALKDADGNDTNFIKLRDLAQILSGTGARFEVTWDGAVNVRPGRPYTPNGSELSTPYSGNRAYEVASAETRVDGRAVALGAILLKDDGGNGYTYYKLRDLGKALGFNVGWSADRGVYVETGKPYAPNN